MFSLKIEQLPKIIFPSLYLYKYLILLLWIFSFYFSFFFWGETLVCLIDIILFGSGLHSSNFWYIVLFIYLFFNTTIFFFKFQIKNLSFSFSKWDYCGGPKCYGSGSWDRSHCNPPWSNMCTNCAQFAKAFDHMPMIGETAKGKLRQTDVIKITKEMCSSFR